ncbi:MAG TPA: NifU family protein [Trebonia sp.]|nr:NifU family protein [Trebonia sp.]
MAERPDGSGGRLSGPQIEERLALLDLLLDQIERVPGPGSELALDAVATLTAIYGEALARVVDVMPGAAAGLAADELLGHLLTLHGLSPVPAWDRIVAALKDVGAQGGDIRLASLDGAVARVQLAAHGCSSATAPLRAAITDAVLAAAPELAAVEVEAAPVTAEPALIPVEALRRPGQVSA